jgi:hypothetical protein
VKKDQGVRQPRFPGYYRGAPSREIDGDNGLASWDTHRHNQPLLLLDMPYGANLAPDT